MVSTVTGGMFCQLLEYSMGSIWVARGSVYTRRPAARRGFGREEYVPGWEEPRSEGVGPETVFLRPPQERSHHTLSLRPAHGQEQRGDNT